MKKFRSFLDRFGLDRQSAKSFSVTCLIVGIVISAFLAMFFSWSEVKLLLCLVPGLLVALFGAFIYIAYAPCPHCGGYIDHRHAGAVYCPHCGKELD